MLDRALVRDAAVCRLVCRCDRGGARGYNRNLWMAAGGEERGVPSWLLKPDSRGAVHEEVRRMLSIVASDQSAQNALKLDLDALVLEGARRMLLAALKAD